MKLALSTTSEATYYHTKAESALGVAGVMRVDYGLEVVRSVRTAGGAGAYCVATRTAC